MDILKNILSQEIIQRLGWTLVHFVWQAAAIALLLAIVLRLLHKSSANLRYIIACMALALIVLMPAATLKMLDVPAEIIEPVKLAPVDLPKAEFDAPALVEIPRLQSPPTQTAVTPKVPLKDRFIEAVEPALPFIVVGWLVGVFGLSLWHLGGWAQLQRLRRKMVKQVSERVNLRLRYLAEKLGIKRTVEIAESALVQVPAVVGWLKPVILLPASALTGLTRWQLEAILAHELAHIKRCDYLVNMLQTAVEILGFYHPAVWWVSHKIRAERENCCDDLAVSVSGDRVGYARALTSLEEVRAGYTLAVAASGGGLFERIRRLLAKDPAKETKLSWLPSAIAIMLIASLLIPVSFAMSGRLKPESETAAQKELSEFKAALPNGVSVELVGVCEHPSEGKQWWRPDGSLLEQRPWEKVNGAVNDGWGKEPYEFAVRLNHVANNVPGWYVTFEDSGSMASGVYESSPTSITGWFAVSLPSDKKELDITISVAPGKWETKFSRDVKPDSGVYAESSNKRGVAWFSPVETDGKTFLVVSHGFREQQTRVVAVDKKGKEHTGQYDSGTFNVSSDTATLQAFFPLTLDQIEEFRLQTRPYQKYVFKNVSLKPNFKTNVQIEVENPVVPVEGSYSIRHFVRVVTDDENDRVTFEGRELDYNELPQNLEPLLENVLDRAHTVLEIAFAPGTMPEKGSLAWLGISSMLGRLEEKYGFEYLSIVGEHPLGSKGEPSETYFEGLLQFDKEIPIQLQSAEKPPLLKCRSIKFNRIDDAITADISMNVTSYPKTRWEFRLRLLDAESKEIKAAYQTFENSGIIETLPDLTEEDLLLLLGKSDAFENAKKFEVRIRQIIGEDKPAAQVKPMESDPRWLQFEELRQRSESLKKLRSLGLMLIMYANDHDERYPYGLELIKRYDDKDEVVSWALENVGYLGRGRSAAVEPQALIAYDKTMLLENGCTNLLFNDSHVEFCEKKRVKDIKFGGSSLLDIENRWNSAQKLSDLGKAMLIFANDHEEKYPDKLEDLTKVDLTKEEIDWLKKNIEYLGHKEKPTSRPNNVLAYDKTLLEKGQGTNVLYNSFHVQFEKPEKLKKLGIKTDSSTGRIEDFKRQLQEPVTVHIAHSPENNRLSVQYAVMAVCKAAGVPYNWDKSAELTDTECRQYVEPVNIENNIASQAIADMVGPVGLLYDVDADGVYLYKPEKAAEIKSNLEILNIELEPVAQGKNVFYANVKNTSDTEQLFAVHIYTRSVDYGLHGVGWGTRFFEKLEPNETRRARFVYKIQGPVTENTYIRVKFYNPATEEQYNYDKPFEVHLYKGSDLKKQEPSKELEAASSRQFDEISKTLETIQNCIRNKEYKKAWDLFTEDHKKAEYQSRGFESFERQMEPKHPLDSAFTWEKSQFLKLKPKQLDINDSATLLATYKKETWKISFTKEANQWKIDDIVGYRPRILDIQEADNK